MNDYWARERDSSLKHIAFVTIGGGANDIQVPSAFTTSSFADVDETLLSVCNFTIILRGKSSCYFKLNYRYEDFVYHEYRRYFSNNIHFLN